MLRKDCSPVVINNSTDKQAFFVEDKVNEFWNRWHAEKGMQIWGE